MTILIDAWLERREPSLRVWDCDAREVLVEWHGANLRSLLEQGLLELDDLADSVWSLLRQATQEKKLLTSSNDYHCH
ncbi:MAG: hypothetical protein PHD37_18205 [Gallionellaceae bacterium]|nr:hypothetical protein [Gallionellaceae bacterium]